MKIELLPCFYLITGHMACFSINCWYVGKYPLSYTAWECAEVYCELVGWKFLNLYKVYGDVETYSMRVEMPSDEVAERTIFDNYYDAADLGSY